MSGKRLLDVAKLVNATLNVGKQHIAIRQEQWDKYSRTSSLAKAVKNQTDRVTVTASAAAELVKRFNETGPSWQQAPRAAQEKVKEEVEKWRMTGNAHTESAESTAYQEQPITQDVFSERPDAVGGTQSTSSEPPIPLHGVQSPTENTQTEATKAELAEGVNLDGLFYSRRVSRDVGQTGAKLESPYGKRKRAPPRPLPEMVEAEKRRKEERAEEASKLESVMMSRSEEEASKSEPGAQAQPTAANADSVDAKAASIDEADAETQKLAESLNHMSENQSTTEDKPETISYDMHESRVPSSRFGRLWQYGGLATSMAFGAVGESFRRVTGGSSEGSVMLSEANMNRLVSKLSRMRGAALKLGQMLSFQDSKMLPETINKVLQRVQDSADYMPPSQRDKVLVDNLGANWRELFSSFEEKPFAAASIGQVHKATLASNGKDVAVKVQYPGVKNSIDSDLNNLSLLLTASRLLPKGLFLDKTIANARVELAWECDYEREAEACIRFSELLQEESDTFTIPTIYKEASGPGVLTAEFMHGTAVTKMSDLTQHDRDWVGTQILRLCLRELMEWRFMQTDPNWTNFLYNRSSQKLELLDFGASREFPAEFVEPYVSLLIAASKGDRESCRDLSIELGYLTGREGKEMVRAHVDSIMTLAEPFVESAPEVYDFKDQTITDRVRENIGLMLRERLAPPPEETYSLHRKLSGAFLLCARLNSRVRAREMFARAKGVWEGREKGEVI